MVKIGTPRWKISATNGPTIEPKRTQEQQCPISASPLVQHSVWDYKNYYNFILKIFWQGKSKKLECNKQIKNYGA